VLSHTREGVPRDNQNMVLHLSGTSPSVHKLLHVLDPLVTYGSLSMSKVSPAPELASKKCDDTSRAVSQVAILFCATTRPPIEYFRICNI
jgi:hypothetical protein